MRNFGQQITYEDMVIICLILNIMRWVALGLRRFSPGIKDVTSILSVMLTEHLQSLVK